MTPELAPALYAPAASTGVQLLLLYLAGGTLGSLAHCGWYYYQACKTGEPVRCACSAWVGEREEALQR